VGHLVQTKMSLSHFCISDDYYHNCNIEVMGEKASKRSSKSNLPSENSTEGDTLPQNVNKKILPKMFHAATVFTCCPYYKAIMQLPRIPHLLRPRRNYCFMSDLKHTGLGSSWDSMSSHRNTDCKGERKGKEEDKAGSAEEMFWFCNLL